MIVWAVGATAQNIQVHLVAWTYTLFVLFWETLGRERGMKEEKVERKHAEELREREEGCGMLHRRWMGEVDRRDVPGRSL